MNGPRRAGRLTFDHISHLDVAHAWRLGHGLRARIVRIVPEDEHLALARPGSLDVGYRVLRTRSRRGDNNRQHQGKISHRISSSDQGWGVAVDVGSLAQDPQVHNEPSLR